MLKWNMEMEENFIDLLIINELLKEKKLLKGDFDKEFYIKERKVDFEKASVCEGRMKIYLPVEREQTESFGSKFTYPPQMGAYEEYICEGGAYGVTIEICDLEDETKQNETAKEVAGRMKEDIQEKYEDTCVYIANIFENDDWLCCLLADGEIEDKRVFSYIYVLRKGTTLYRIYVLCKKDNWRELAYLAKKMVNKIEWMEE